jgi:hypothetical protein
MTESDKKETVAEELRLLGESLFALGRTAFEKSRRLSIDSMRKARTAVDNVRDDLEKTDK